MLSIDPSQRPPSRIITESFFLLTQRARLLNMLQPLPKLSKKTPASQLQIECERLIIWISQAGLALGSDTSTSEWHNDRQHSWLTDTRGRMPVVGTLLSAAESELDSLWNIFQQDNPVAPVFERLRELNDSLWCLPPQTIRETMFRML